MLFIYSIFEKKLSISSQIISSFHKQKEMKYNWILNSSSHHGLTTSQQVSKLPFPACAQEIAGTFSKPRLGKNSTTDPVTHDVH